MRTLPFTFNESNLVQFNPVLQPPLSYSPSGEAAFLSGGGGMDHRVAATANVP